MEMQTPAMAADATPDPADIAFAQAEARQRRRRRWLVGLGVVGMLAGYPLSAGPLNAMLDAGVFPRFIEGLVEVYFAPLEWAYYQSEMIKAFYDWYLPFFEVSR